MAKKCLLISPHFDDAVLSAGQFMAGRSECDVLTVFSGTPKKYVGLTPYDESCGFTSSTEAMEARRWEDGQALALLDANPLYADLLDSQYLTEDSNHYIKGIVHEFIKTGDYEMILAPLGLRHPDHITVSDVVLSLGLNNLYLWEDLPARVQYPELVYERLKQVLTTGSPSDSPVFIGDGPIADKIRALWCYKSQMNTGDLDPYLLYVPERFHHYV